MSVIRTGQPGPILINQEPAFIQGQGWVWREVQRGSREDIEGLMPGYISAGYSFDVDDAGPFWFLFAEKQAASQSETQGFIDRFTFRKEIIERDIYARESVQQEAEAFSSIGMVEYRALIEDVVSDESDQYSEVIINSPQFDAFPVMRQVLIERTRGVSGYEDEYLTMKRTRVVGLAYAPQLQLQATGIIYTPSELFSVFALPPFVAVTFPPNPAYAPPDTLWGWRSRVQRIDYIEDKKVQVEQDWALAHWSTNLYTPFS